MNVQSSLVVSYDYPLVVCSIVIALITAYTAINLAGRVIANQGYARVAWLAGGACAMGSGIWSMHFTGMLAYRLPLVVFYHVPTVMLSLVAAIFASFVALYFVSQEQMTKLQVLAGGLLMGSGISVMHYTGMAAMRLPAMHSYNHAVWLLSVVLAIVISLAGLLLMYYSRDEDDGRLRRLSCSLCVGLAIPIMHYTGMAAVRFMPTSTPPDLAHAVTISFLVKSGILLSTCLILAFALLTSLVDRRHSAQQARFENERKMLRALIDNIPDFMYVKDRESRFVIANPEVARWMGVEKPEDLIGKSDFDFFSHAIATGYFENEQQVMQSAQPLFNHEESAFDAAGNPKPILTTKVPLRDSRGRVTGIAGVGRDISERKKNEDDLREAERKYHGIFDEASVGIFQISPDGHLLSVNRALAAMFGYGSPEEMVATMSGAWEAHVDAKCQDETVAALKKTGKLQSLEREVLRRDGTRIWISSSLHSICDQTAVLRYEGMSEDITERRLLRDQLLQAQKLESVGQLAAGIAHEVNTPIQYVGDNVRFLEEAFRDLQQLITSYAQLHAAVASKGKTDVLLAKVSATLASTDAAFLMDEIPKAFAQTMEGVARVSTLVNAMKEFSHPGTKQKTPYDLNRAIQSTVTVARNEWKYVADLTLDLDAALPMVPCEGSEFNQVILNMIVNAAHAIGERISKGEAEKGEIKLRTRAVADWIEISIADSGAGIPEEARSRIFDPFFTTKEVGRGSGQGLAIARSVIVDRHQGSIDFETKLGVGTTFTIRLPRASETAAVQGLPA